MALIDIKKLKEVDLSKLKDKASETFETTKEQANTLTTKAIQHLLKGIDLDGLLVRVGEYQQKTGKDASKLVDFINNLKQMQQDGNGE